MIDAYEIGIQLMLQDDVSAGLAVINRGLAEVDRAIAATSADLAGLVREAETATKVVAVSGRTVLASPTGPKTDDKTAEQIRGASREEPLPTSATQPGEKISASEINTGKPVAPTTLAASQQRGVAVGPVSDRSEQAISSSAPIRTVVDETIVSGQRANLNQAQPDTTAVVSPAQISPNKLSSNELAAPPAREVAATGQETRQSVTPGATQVALTASVNRERWSATAREQSERPGHQLILGPAARRQRPVAPWSGVEQSGIRAETTRLHEKAVAPQYPGRNQNEPAGGTVMLDGRLVGEWLSEHMGREASRPPSGTSFFDPRQTPAWNVSGAL